MSGMSLNPARTFASAVWARDSPPCGSTSSRQHSGCCWRPSSRASCIPHQGRTMQHYDVIIIGTRRGRRHARLPARAVRQADPAPRARRLRAAREGELGLARGQRRGPLPHAKRRGATATASRSTRTRTTTSAATRSSTARRCSGCASRTSASCRTPAACRRRGRSRTRISSRTTRDAEHLYHVHGERGEDPTEPWASAPYRIRRSRTSRASSSCTTTSRAPGCSPFHVPLGVMLDEANPARARASAATPATASRAWSTRSPTPR